MSTDNIAGNDFQQVQKRPTLRLWCPVCHSHNLQASTDTSFSTSTFVTKKDVMTTVESSVRHFWVCADCGSSFPFPQEVKQKAEQAAKDAKLGKTIAVIEAVLGIICGMFYMIVPIPMFPIFCFMSLVVAGLVAFVASLSGEKSQKLQAQYEELIAQCYET